MATIMYIKITSNASNNPAWLAALEVNETDEERQIMKYLQTKAHHKPQSWGNVASVRTRNRKNQI